MSETDQNREIQVYAHWDTLDEPKFMGEIHELTVRGKALVSFEAGLRRIQGSGKSFSTTLPVKWGWMFPKP